MGGSFSLLITVKIVFKAPAFSVYAAPVKVPQKLNSILRAPRLTRTRILLALAVAVTADGLQLLLGPLGWALIDQVIDVVAMALTVWILGFHILLLPTFVVELIPVADMLPTWTGCTAAVIALRKRAENAVPPPTAPSPPQKPTIEI
jgi:hypothetical protein